MTTPAACVEEFRFIPSSTSEMFLSVPGSSIPALLHPLESGSVSSASAIGVTLPWITGICLVMDSVTLSGTPSTRRPFLQISSRPLRGWGR